MVKYLNNRKQKSRSDRQDNTGNQVEPQSGQENQSQGQNQHQDKNKVPGSQDNPVTSKLSKAWSMAKRILTYQPSEEDDHFSLGERRTQANAQQYGTVQADNSPVAQPQAGQDTDNLVQKQPNQDSLGNSGGNSKEGDNRKVTHNNQQDSRQQEKGAGSDAQGPREPSPAGTAPYYQHLASQNKEQQQVHHTQQGGTPPSEQAVPVERQVHFDLDKNLDHLKRAFDLPTNKGFTIREFLVGFEPAYRAFVLFAEGLADKNIINQQILDPLMILSSLRLQTPYDPIELAKQRLVSANQVEEKRDFTAVIDAVLSGSTALFIDGSNAALLIETKGWEHRSIGSPKVENVVRGPQEGFNELLIANMALVRSRLRTESLVSEMFKVGRISKADVAVMYLKDTVNPAIVQEVRKRLTSLQDVDYVPDTGILEQFIEDSPFSLTPQMLSTERPDRVASYLTEGHVAILMSSTPFALIVPVTFWALLHSAEDSYVRWPYGGLMRTVRVFCLLIGMFLPALYVAVVNYHQAMLPPDLLFSIAAAREKIPFPAVVEVIIMEAAIELIREAGIRIPTIIGTTIGIVGALILGQAAVQANLINPLVIIIVALTGLGSAAIPNYNLSFNVRLIRFAYIALASIAGFYSLGVGIVVHMASLSKVKSFGIPILTPASPNRPSTDRVYMSPTWAQEKTPNFVRPLRGQRQPAVSRGWSPKAVKRRGDGQ